MKVLLLVMSLFLSGCGATAPLLYKDRPVVISVPHSMYYCPDVAAIKAKRLSEKDIAHLLIQYQNVRNQCKASLDAIEAYLKEAKTEIETQK